MTNSDTLTLRFYRGRAQLGTTRFVLNWLYTILLFGGVAVLLIVDEPRGTLNLFVAILFSLKAVLKFTEPRGPEWLFGLMFAVGALILWARHFAIISLPLLPE